jgi:hypothetical protein
METERSANAFRSRRLRPDLQERDLHPLKQSTSSQRPRRFRAELIASRQQAPYTTCSGPAWAGEAEATTTCRRLAPPGDGSEAALRPIAERDRLSSMRCLRHAAACRSTRDYLRTPKRRSKRAALAAGTTHAARDQGIVSTWLGVRSLGKQCGCSKPVGTVPAGA